MLFTVNGVERKRIVKVGNNFGRIYCSDTGETASGLNAYYRTRHWKAFRLLIIAERPECERCFDPAPNPDIHHKTYKRLGKERMTDVSLLCKKCHAVIHSKREGRKRARQKSFAASMTKAKESGLSLGTLTRKLVNELCQLEEPELLKVLEYVERRKAEQDIF